MREHKPSLQPLPDCVAEHAGEITRIDIEFELLRAYNVSVELTPDPSAPGAAAASDGPPLRGARLGNSPNVFSVDLPPGGPSATALSHRPFVVDRKSMGDETRISAFVLHLKSGARIVARPIGDARAQSPSAYSIENIPASDAGAPATIGPAEYVAQMRSRLIRDDELAKARLFFFELDCETHPLLRPQRAGDPQIPDGLAGALAARVKASAEMHAHAMKMAKDGKLSDADAQAYILKLLTNDLGLPDTDTQGYVRNVLRMMKGIMERCFSPTEKSLDVLIERYREAIIAFAAGQTRFQLSTGKQDGDAKEVDCGMWTTQPSSGYFFLFAEVALLGAEMTNDPDAKRLWAHAAEVAIRAQEVFVKVFSDGTPKLGFNSFTTFDIDPCSIDDANKLVGNLTDPALTPNIADLRCEAARNAAKFMPALLS